MNAKAITSQDRMRAVLTGNLPDRVPFFPTIFTDHACIACGKRFEDALIDPAVGTDCMLSAALLYQTDTVRFPLGPPASWYEEKLVAERDGRLTQFSRKSGKAEGYFDIEGGGMFLPLEPPPAIRSEQEVGAIGVITAEEYLQRGYLRDVMRCVRAAHDHGLFVVGMCAGQTINFMVEKMGGTEAALILFYDDPALARALIDKAVAISIEKAKAFVKAGVDCIYFGDSYASASVISPQCYRDFCKPAYVRMAREIHRMGVFCYKHCCGNYNLLLDELPSIGLDAMDGIDPTSGMSVKHTKERIGDKLTLMGGISCLTLLRGTPAAVHDEARQCVLDGKPGGRYVLGTACAVPRHTPAQNMAAARAAAVEFGTYG